jgi:hypothetical protein
MAADNRHRVLCRPDDMALPDRVRRGRLGAIVEPRRLERGPDDPGHRRGTWPVGIVESAAQLRVEAFDRLLADLVSQPFEHLRCHGADSAPLQRDSSEMFGIAVASRTPPSRTSGLKDRHRIVRSRWGATSVIHREVIQAQGHAGSTKTPMFAAILASSKPSYSGERGSRADPLGGLRPDGVSQNLLTVHSVRTHISRGSVPEGSR